MVVEVAVEMDVGVVW